MTKLAYSFLKEVKSTDIMHYSHLLNYIGGYHDKLFIEEFGETLAQAVKHAKETGSISVISYDGHFDLLVTPHRIQVILVTKTFELPQIIEEETK